MSDQSVVSKQGEIEFRRKLYEQQVEGCTHFEDEFDAKAIEAILLHRMEKTQQQMQVLVDQEIRLSPYIEIGAERCQRSLVMENDLSACGAAVDISFEMLKSGAYYQAVFSKTKMPLRICCDAYHLPFRSDSIPFVFCYETLHHFPSPAPIIQEAHRVLAPAGHFFFEEEPYRRALHLDLYKGKKIYSPKALHSPAFRQLVDSFFASLVCNEIEYGIVENWNISLGEWNTALRVFATREAHLRTVGLFQPFNVKAFQLKNPVRSLVAYLLGGFISGLCQKAGRAIGQSLTRIEDALVCVECLEARREIELVRETDHLVCPHCQTRYPIKDEIMFLFSRRKLAQLYPSLGNG